MDALKLAVTALSHGIEGPEGQRPGTSGTVGGRPGTSGMMGVSQGNGQ